MPKGGYDVEVIFGLEHSLSSSDCCNPCNCELRERIERNDYDAKISAALPFSNVSIELMANIAIVVSLRSM